MDEASLLSFLGLGARAGKLVYGQARCQAGIRDGSVRLLILDGSVSPGTQKTFINACTAHHVPWLLLDGQETLGSSVGRPGCRIVGIADPEFARSVSEKYGTASGRGTD